MMEMENEDDTDDKKNIGVVLHKKEYHQQSNDHQSHITPARARARARDSRARDSRARSAPAQCTNFFFFAAASVRISEKLKVMMPIIIMRYALFSMQAASTMLIVYTREHVKFVLSRSNKM